MMEYLMFPLLLILSGLIAYILFLRMIKYAMLLMHANDRYAIQNLLQNSNPYDSFLVNRDLALSILLNDASIWGKFVKMNKLVVRLDSYLSKFTMGSDYSFIQELEEKVHRKMRSTCGDDFDELILVEYSDKYYFFKLAIILRLHKALHRVQKGNGLQAWREDLIRFDDFSKTPALRSMYLSICNERILESDLQPIDSPAINETQVISLFKDHNLNDFQGFVSSYFYWHENPSLRRKE